MAEAPPGNDESDFSSASHSTAEVETNLTDAEARHSAAVAQENAEARDELPRTPRT